MVAKFVIKITENPKWKDSNTLSDDKMEFESEKVSANVGNIKRVSRAE